WGQRYPSAVQGQPAGSSSRRGRPLQSVVDGLADAGGGNGRHRDAGGSLVQLAQHGEQVGGGFPQIAAWAEIELGARRVAETQQHFTGFDLARVETQRGAWRIVAGELAGRADQAAGRSQ